MSGLRTFLDQQIFTIKDAMAGNEMWQFIAALATFVIGLTLFELSWRYAKGRIRGILEVRDRERLIPYVIGFFPALRLATFVGLLRISEVPLELPAQLQILLHGLEAFLFALALIFFIFQLVRLLDLLYIALPDKIKQKITKRTLIRAKGILRILGIVLVGIVFIYLQKTFLPEWLWKYSWWRYLAVVIVVGLIFVGGRLLNKFLSDMTLTLKSKEEKARLRLVLEASHRPLYLLLTTIAIYAVTAILSLPEKIDGIATTAVDALVVLVIFLFIYRLLDVIEHELTKFVKRDDNRLDQNFVQMVRMITRVLVVVFGIIYLLQVITGKPMNTLLAGLGIGGLAVALAAQDTLKNLFGSFMIMVDKPFAVGDWVVADGVEGNVEEVGFRSTRIRTFSGHLVSVPNERMASVNIDNVQRRPGIRRRTSITVTYDTPPDKVQRAVDIIKDILANCEEVHHDYPFRVVFDEFNDTSLNILVLYWYRRNDYWEAKAFDEKVNFMILRAFEEEGIEFAFPTTTTYLAHDERRPLSITVTNESKDT